MPIAPGETGIANGNGQMNGHMHGHANEMPVLAAGQQGNTFTDANEKPVLAAGQQGNTFTNANEMPVLAAGQQGSAFYLDDAKSLPGESKFRAATKERNIKTRIGGINC